MKITQLGYGKVGKAIAHDLARQGHEVTVANNVEGTFEKGKYEKVDVLNPSNLRKLIETQDLVFNALPGHLGYRTSEAVIKNGKNLVDISFYPESHEPLVELAKEYGVIVAFDVGVAPGAWNMILAHCEEELDETTSATCMVGGLPVNPEPPYYYRAPFSPHDVIEEYVRPARILENGEIKTKEALSELELVNVGKLTLESFNTDGLRSLLSGMKTPTIKEKTLRWPGHVRIMKTLRETGFFSRKGVEFNSASGTFGGIYIRPLDMTAKLLFPHWDLKPDERDFTVMNIVINGKKDGETVQRKFYLYDEGQGDESSMARTTGYTATAVVDLIDKGLLSDPGFYKPEDIGRKEDCYNHVMTYLSERNVRFETT